MTGAEIDLALFKLSVKTFDPWAVGIIGAAGVLTALVPGSMILMTTATLVANNLYRVFDRSAADARVLPSPKCWSPRCPCCGLFHAARWPDHRCIAVDGL